MLISQCCRQLPKRLLIPVVSQQVRCFQSSTSFDLLEISHSDDKKVASITLNSPKTRNALSERMMTQLRSAFNESQASNPDLRVVVLKGNGPAFSSGHNLKELTKDNQEAHSRIFGLCNDLMADMMKLSVPIIAGVDGVAAAAGCQLVSMCDIVVATEKSKFSTPGAAFGLFCSTPGVPLARTVPRKVSAYMLLTGNFITAEEALRAGLVSKLVKDEKRLEEEIDSACAAIISKPKSVIELGRKFYYEQLELPISEALDRGGRTMVENLRYKDCQEGIGAFAQKRHPSWSHTDEKVD